jgi:Flp pilus assembly protein TadG
MMRRRDRGIRWRVKAHHDERGQAIVEMALVLPLMLVLIVAIADVARAAWTNSTLATAAREGSRYAIVHGAESDDPSGPGSARFTAPDRDTGVEAVVRAKAVGVRDVQVTVRWPDGNNGRGSRVVVEASVVFVPSMSDLLLNGAFRLTLSSSSTLVIHR